MRIGEFKLIVDKSLTDANQIELTSEALYGGEVHTVSEFKDLYQTLNLLMEQEWNDLPSEELKAVLDKFSGENDKVQLSAADFNTLNGYISSVNQKLPIAMSVIDSLAPIQEEQIVNIQLPKNIESIGGLQTFNKRLDKIFKKFNISGEFKFAGFDIGTDWYQVLITTDELYKYVMASVGLAIAILKLKNSYYDAETAKLAYETAKRKDEDLTETQHLNEVVETKVEEDAKEIVNNLGTPNNQAVPEMTSMVVGSVKELVKELEQGTEFHMSLNPPKYLAEEGSGLTIKYKSIPKISAQKKETAQISDGNKATKTEEDK